MEEIEVTIGDKIFKFKKNLIGADLLAILDEKQLQQANMVVRLVARASTTPKLSNKDVIMLPIVEFVKLLKEVGQDLIVPEEFHFLAPE